MEDLPLGRIAVLVPEFAVKDLPLDRILMMIYTQGVPKLFAQIHTRGREHQNKYISIRIIWSLKSTCNVREHFVSGADVSCCVGVADWACTDHSIRTFSKDSFCRHL